MKNMGIHLEKEGYEDLLNHLPVDGKYFRVHGTWRNLMTSI